MKPPYDLIHAYFMKNISPEDFDRLCTWLEADPKHVDLLVRESVIHEGIHHILTGEKLRQEEGIPAAEVEWTPACPGINDQESILARYGSEDEKQRQIEQYAELQLQRFLAEQEALRRAASSPPSRAPQWPRIDFQAVGRRLNAVLLGAYRSVVVGTLLLALGLTVTIGIQYILSHRVAATVGDSVDARWEMDPPESGLLPGWATLLEGYARLDFKSGARVILQAPCELRLKSTKRVFLGSGQLTVKVPEGLRGFTVLTPTAGLVDYGTEFGVRVDARGDTESHVFSGQVNVRAGKQNRLLTEGLAVRVDTAKNLRVSPLQDRPDYFTRRLPDKNTTGRPTLSYRKPAWIHLDLAHVAGGGDGVEGPCPNFALDPSTGRIHSQIATRSPKGRQGDRHYHAVASLAYVDGIFVPDGNHRPVVSSAGHVFVDCPQTTNSFWSDIGVTRTRQDQYGQGYQLTLDGRDYCTPAHPGINMHANTGITFDLQAIRGAYPDRDIVRFQTTCGLSTMNLTPNDPLVDMWVLVDGEVQFAALGLSRGQYKTVRLSMEPEGRFLSLVCTDGGDWISGDHAVFGEPELALKSKDQTPKPNTNKE